MESSTNSSGWFVVTLSPQTLVTALSPVTGGFAGYTSRDMIGCPITQFLADKTTFELPRILNMVKEGGQWEGEVVYRDRHGKEFKNRGNILLLSDNKNRHSGYLLFSRLSELQDSRDDGIASKYADVGLRVRALIHDLNNPLAVIMGSTQLLTLNTRCTGKMRSDIEKLYSELQKVARVVEELHGYAFSLCEKSVDPAQPEDTVRNSA